MTAEPQKQQAEKSETSADIYERVVLSLLLLALMFCCGCAARGDEFAKGERVEPAIRATDVEQWRESLVDAARLIYAGQVEQGREYVIDVTRSMYAATQEIQQAPSSATATDRESGARNWNAPAADAGGDGTAPTLTRAAEALGDIATKTER